MTDPSSPQHLDTVPLRKVATGIAGLDQVLLGGVPEGRTTLVAGSTGTGKTVLALEFLVDGAQNGEPAVFLTFEERADAIRANARAIGWNLDPLENSGQLVIVEPELPLHVAKTGDFNIAGLLAILTGHCERIGARRVVIDAIDVLLRLFENEIDQQNQLALLNRWLLDAPVTALLTIKIDDGWIAGGAQRHLAYLVDCLIQLDQSITGQVTTRRLRVVKYRGSGFRANQFPYIIAEGGFELLPVTGFELSQSALGDHITSGSPDLDTVLGGGYRRGSSILISGASGTGKTTFAATFARSACARGERVLFVSFEESAEALSSALTSVGIDLQEHLDAGRLNVFSTMPEAAGAEEHLIRILKAIREFDPSHLVLDAVTGTLRIGTEKAAFDFMIRLVQLCKERGITCMYTNQTPPGPAVQHASGLGISSLVDAVIALEQVWFEDVHQRRLLVVKSRGARHSNRLHLFEITDNGLRVDISGARMNSPGEMYL